VSLKVVRLSAKSELRELGRRLVFGEPALQDAAGQHPDEAAALDDRHAFGVLLLHELERLLDRR
jgi:hypothetical protein